MAARKAVPATPAATPAAATLADLGDDVRRAWRRWRARGHEGPWYRVTEAGFVPYARAQGLDVPSALADESVATLDAWAADSLAREPIE